MLRSPKAERGIMSKPGPIAQIREGVRLLKGLRSNPNIGQELRQSRLFRRLTRALPPKVLQHYLYPLVAGMSQIRLIF